MTTTLGRGDGVKSLHTGFHVKEFTSLTNVDLTLTANGAPIADLPARWMHILAATTGATITIETGAGQTQLSAKTLFDLGIPIVCDIRKIVSASNVTRVMVTW